MTDYPDDADGNALRRVANDGSDMSKPMDVDFMIAVDGGIVADAIAATARSMGFETEVVQEADDGDDGEIDGETKESPGDVVHWTVYCTKNMLLTYDDVVAVQAELDEISRPHGGKIDGWGTFGNADDVEG